MKLSLNWLKHYIDHGLTAEDLSSRLTMAGLEVEAIDKFGDDTVFELEITPNRPDCLNILGLAREVSAITGKDMAPPAVNDHDDAGDVSIVIEDPDGCGRYIGTLIDGVHPKAIPVEQAKLLQAIGCNTICNIVDITNFAMFENGQPLHAFDFDKLEGGKIVVRRARKGEKIVTLDDVERELDESILVIADAKKPVAIAGIMGGRDTGVTSSTRRVLLEAASFDLGLIRRASRKLGLTSDSCYRFERGVAWKHVELGSNRATDMILEFAGGKVVARKDVIAKETQRQRAEIKVSVADIQALLGAPLELARCEKILKRLGCIVVVGSNTLTVVPPHFRNDLKIKEDVIEEIARVVGYDNLPMTLPHVKAENIAIDIEKETFHEKVAGLMVAQGINEIVSYALMSSAALEKIGHVGPVIGLQNPLSAEQELMRPTALANFLQVAASNLNHGQRNLKLFEIGKKYLPGGERWCLSILMFGRKDSDWRRSKKDLVDFADLKGVIEEVLAKARVQGLAFMAVDATSYEPGQCAAVSINGQSAGLVGKVSGTVLANFDIKKVNVYFAEIDLGIVAETVAPREKFAELNEFPAAVRDISLAVKGTTFEAIRSLCQENGRGLLKKIDFLELYTGDKMESGCKGYVLSLTYQADDRTLTDEEVNALHEEIIRKLIEKFEVKRR
jgi:phenylalanyl-tRNA synthetase beta chain